MKRYLIFFVALCTSLSCTKTELETENEISGTKLYCAEVPYEDSKTYIDTDYEIHWTADDRISVFCSPANEQYRFTGATGAQRGTFENMTEPATPTFSRNYAVYPYQPGNTSASEGAMTVSFPPEQSYAETSFGPRANTMVAVTESLADDKFKFRNCCGYLMLKLYGGDKIKSITLRGNNGEKIAGPSTITAEYGKDPTIAMEDDATTEITLICPAEGVPTNESEESFTQFWIALPPTTFSNGFTVEITNTEDNVISRSTSNSVTINRNKILKMAPVKVDSQNSKELLSFSLSDGVNTYKAFDISDGYVNVQVPNGTDMTAMTATFEHNGVSVKVNGVPQTSGVDSHDFSDFVNPVSYVVTSKAGTSQSYIIRMFDLPVVIIFTADHKGITDKVNYKACEIKLVDNEITIDNSFIDAEASIKGRGNATWNLPKKAFNIKLSKKVSVLGMPKHKKWCFLANYNDRTLMRNDVCQEISRFSTNLGWGPYGRFVDVIINGDIIGNYWLCEKIEVDENRLDIDKSAGLLVEYDRYEDDYRFASQLLSPRYGYPEYVKIKAPIDKAEDDPEGVWLNTVRQDIDNLESVLTGSVKGDYEELMDVDSFVEYMLFNDFCDNTDAGGNSTYMHKKKDCLWKAGPVWDFDFHSFSESKNIKLGNTKTSFYFPEFMRDPRYVQRVKQIWPYMKDKLATDYIKDYINNIYNQIKNSASRDEQIWPCSKKGNPNGDMTLTFEGAKNRLLQMYSARLELMNNWVNSLVVKYDSLPGGNEDVDVQEDKSDEFGFGF